MNLLGSLSSERKFIRWSRADIDAVLNAASIGLFAGVAVTFIRTPLHLPGHKAILWIAPALVCRMATRARAAAFISVLSTMIATLLLGGQLGGGGGGGVLMMPLVLVAGITLDITVGVVERQRLKFASALVLLAMGGIAGNLLCFIKRLGDPVGPFFSAGNIQELLWVGGSHALFGLLAGVIGGICGWGFIHRITATNGNS